MSSSANNVKRKRTKDSGSVFDNVRNFSLPIVNKIFGTKDPSSSAIIPDASPSRDNNLNSVLSSNENHHGNRKKPKKTSKNTEICENGKKSLSQDPSPDVIDSDSSKKKRKG